MMPPTPAILSGVAMAGWRRSFATRRPVRLLLALIMLIMLTWSIAAVALEGAPVDVKRVAMIGFTVSDMDRSVAFYSDVLAFEKVADFRVNGPTYDNLEGVFGVNMRIVHLKLGEQTVELTQYASPPGGRPIPVPSRSNDLWFEHLAIVVSNMEKAYEVLQRHQVRQISPEPQTIPPSNVPAAGIKALKFRDPDNHDLELIWFPPGKGAAGWQQSGVQSDHGVGSGWPRDAPGGALRKAREQQPEHETGRISSLNVVDRSLPSVARLCLVLLFPFSALDKIFDYGNAVAQADASGLPVPGWLLLLLGGGLEVFGSLGILLNIYARPLALLFCFYCVATAVLFHNFWIYPFGGADWQANFWPFLKNIGLVGGFLFIASNARMEPLGRAFTIEARPRS